ncbi:MAG TPA: group III truncated hemoglobin [Cytophagaceae bacterium]
MVVKEISTLDDIKILVDSFYTKVRKDDLLADIFNNVIKDQWPAHLQKMYTFWQTILLEEHTYFGSPFVPHAKLPVNKEHFDRWKMLFNQTVDEHFTGTIANEAKWRAERMAEMFIYKIEYLRKDSSEYL